MKTLHLNLKKKWFDMILSGEKTEEYREIKEYWEKRLGLSDLIEDPDRIKTITFSNGYAKDRPHFKIEMKGIKIGEGVEKWGAEAGKKYFVIKLGKIKHNEKNKN